MRHNQNGRHMRGGRRGGNGGGGGHHHGGNSGGGNHAHSGGGQRRVNPRVQTFDSNGPEVRIRGNAFQINEKYITLARDAQASGDRILAESYLQHAEHYQRFINEMNEEFARQNPNVQPPPFEGQQPQQSVADEGAPQPSVDGMPDLDQGFLVGNRQQSSPAPDGQQPQPDQGQRQPRHRNFPRHQETEAV